MMVHGPRHFVRRFLQILKCPRQWRATTSLTLRIPTLPFEATNGHAFDAHFAPFFAVLPIIENNIQSRRNSGRGTLPRHCEPRERRGNPLARTTPRPGSSFPSSGSAGSHANRNSGKMSSNRHQNKMLCKPRQCPVLVREFASQPDAAETAS